MTKKVLITCPPMLKQIDKLSDYFKKYEMEITTPEVIQTLSINQLKKIVPLHDGWIIGDDPATGEVFAAGKSGRLSAAVKWGIGVDNVDFESCKSLGISIQNTPGMFGSEVADLAMCYILGLARDAFYIDHEIRKGFWVKPAGISLPGKTIGIVGLGDIGRNIAKRAKAHDLKIIGWDPFAKNLPEYINLLDSFPCDLNLCDFLVFACPLTKNNFHMFNKNTLNLVKPGLRLINVSRGSLIDESSLVLGLQNGKLNSVALDVFENEPLSKDNSLLNFPRCILGSHNGSNTIDAVMRTSIYSIELLNKFLYTNE